MPLCSQICGTSPPHLGTEWHPDPSMGGERVGGGGGIESAHRKVGAFSLRIGPHQHQIAICSILSTFVICCLMRFEVFTRIQLYFIEKHLRQFVSNLGFIITSYGFTQI